MSPLSHADQLSYIIEGRIREAVDRHAHGDWSRRDELFDLPRSAFDHWVDTVAHVPTMRIHVQVATFDGIYLIQEGERWTVYEQERGWTDPRSIKTHATFQEAQRDAFAREYLWCLSLR